MPRIESWRWFVFLVMLAPLMLLAPPAVSWSPTRMSLPSELGALFHFSLAVGNHPEIHMIPTVW